jgi:hypothetical protein
MSAATREEIEAKIIRLLDDPAQAHDLTEIVRLLGHSADDASIKAALHRLRAEGLVQITSDWKFQSAAAGSSR